MKYLVFGLSKDLHRLAYRKIRGRRRLHSRCNVRPGKNDGIVQLRAEEAAPPGYRHCQNCKRYR